MTGTVTLLCAIFWFDGEGEAINPNAAYVWTEELANAYVASAPEMKQGLVAVVICKTN